MRGLRQFGMALVIALLALAVGGGLTYADSQYQGGSIRPVQKVWMSDKPNGTGTTLFPSGLKTVYVVFDYKDAADAEIQVRVLDPKGATIFLETKKYSGAGRENLEVTTTDPMIDGSYVTNVYVGLNGNLFLSESNEWNVGKASSAPQPTAAAPVQQPPAAQQSAPNPPAAQPVSASPAQPAVVGGDSSVSAPMLIGAGILVVGLLALVVWAVRGFLNAPKASS